MCPLPASFTKRIEKLEAALAKCDFHILVWGPGASAGETYEKRKRIREHLEATFSADQVHMSEDDAFRPLVEKYGLGVAEAVQVGAIDAVVVLDTSIGPHTEITRYREILRTKAVVFVPHAYKDGGGYAATSFDYFKVEGYTEAELADCQTIRRKANEFCQALRFDKAKGSNFKKLFS